MNSEKTLTQQTLYKSIQVYTHTNIKLNPTDLNWYRTKKYRASIKGFALVCWCLTALSAQIGYIVP